MFCSKEEEQIDLINDRVVKKPTLFCWPELNVGSNFIAHAHLFGCFSSTPPPTCFLKIFSVELGSRSNIHLILYPTDVARYFIRSNFIHGKLYESKRKSNVIYFRLVVVVERYGLIHII